MNTLNQEADAVIERMQAEGMVSKPDKEKVLASLRRAQCILGISVPACVHGASLTAGNLEIEGILVYLEDALNMAQDAITDAMEVLD